MALSRSKKAELIKELSTKMKEAKGIVFARYGGISVKNINALRKTLREQHVDYKVAKKTLILKAAKEAGFKEIADEFLQGPVAVGFGYQDEIIPAKLLHDFSKTVSGLELLGGVFNGALVDQKQILYLATLPSREVLLSMLVGSLKSPMNGFYGVLHGVLRSFVGVLKAHQDKKSS